MSDIMIGWWILVIAQTPEERAVTDDSKEAVLAKWEASLAGIDWIDALVKNGKAAQVRAGGYPSRYRACACDVLPLIASAPPAHDGLTVIGDDYVMPGDWSGDLTVHRDRIELCPPSQTLTIEVWDQS
jgi:hypothetical protein